jgi:hypothetical protein
MTVIGREGPRGLQQPLLIAACISPILLFADTALHNKRIARGTILEVVQRVKHITSIY